MGGKAEGITSSKLYKLLLKDGHNCSVISEETACKMQKREHQYHKAWRENILWELPDTTSYSEESTGQEEKKVKKVKHNIGKDPSPITHQSDLLNDSKCHQNYANRMPFTAEKLP